MSRGVWEAVETKAGKVKMAKTKERREERREWKIWDKEEEAAKSEEKVKKLVPKYFYK